MNLLIVGAGGHGRCCYEIALRMNKFDKVSFVDDSFCLNANLPIVGKISDLKTLNEEYECAFVAIGNNHIRETLLNELVNLNFKLVNLIDPSSVVSRNCSMKEGIVIFPNAVVDPDTTIENGCIISSNVSINHDSHIGSFTLIYSNSVVKARATVGKMVKIGCNCIIESDAVINDCSNVEDGKFVKGEN